MQKLAKALVEFRKECPTIKFDSTNPHFKSKFASLAAIHREIDELLAKHGLVVMQFPVGDAETAGCVTRVIHESGEQMEQEFRVPIKQRDPQAACAAVSYARRYGLSGALGLVTEEDDDGESSMGRSARQEAVKQPQRRSTSQARMSKANRDKIKKAASDRLLEVTGSTSEAEVTALIKAFTANRGFASPLELEDKHVGDALEFIKAYEPGGKAA